LDLPQTGDALRVSKDAVHWFWKEDGLKLHRVERYLASTSSLNLRKRCFQPMIVGALALQPALNGVEEGYLRQHHNDVARPAESAIERCC
jgi:hypothetical protein